MFDILSALEVMDGPVALWNENQNWQSAAQASSVSSPQASFVTLRASLTLSEPRFPHLQNGGHKIGNES